LPHGTILVLGLVTIGAYGAWYYSFGVLLDPILADTGWDESLVAASFAVGGLIGAAASVPSGRLIDRWGSRPAFGASAVLSLGGLWSASVASHPAVFAAGAIVGGASLQGLAFYHITQATAARAAPDRPASAIAGVTIYGAFSSTIYLPLAAALVSATGWRVTLRVLALSASVVLVVAALVIRDRPGPAREHTGLGFRAALARPAARRFVAASGLIGLAVGTALVYQVPLMTGAGLPVATAAWLAGARGITQALGRLPLSPIVARFGARATVRLAFALITGGIALLGLAGTEVVALLYVAAAGLGIGAASPLIGIYASELFERHHLGASIGVVTMVFGVSGALGPALVGVLSEQVGSRWPGVVLAAAAGVVAVSLMGRPADRSTGPTVEPVG
jgi:MFS family permease